MGLDPCDCLAISEQEPSESFPYFPCKFIECPERHAIHKALWRQLIVKHFTTGGLSQPYKWEQHGERLAGFLKALLANFQHAAGNAESFILFGQQIEVLITAFGGRLVPQESVGALNCNCLFFDGVSGPEQVK